MERSRGPMERSKYARWHTLPIQFERSDRSDF